MPRYIKADKEYLEPFFYEHLTDNGMIAAQNAIDEVPTADVQEVKHGKWECADLAYTCSECNAVSFNIDYFCHNCGAKMDGKEKDIEQEYQEAIEAAKSRNEEITDEVGFKQFIENEIEGVKK